MMTMLLLSFALAGDDPRISTSRGDSAGTTVLYPRILPATEDPAVLELARKLHTHTLAIVSQARPGSKTDFRPAPQRTCPRAGCLGVSVGSVLVHNGKTCTIAAWVARPGKSAARPIPWSPGLDVKQTEVPFREPVENALLVRDYMPCDTIIEGLTARDTTVIQAISEAAR